MFPNMLHTYDRMWVNGGVSLGCLPTTAAHIHTDTWAEQWNKVGYANVKHAQTVRAPVRVAVTQRAVRFIIQFTRSMCLILVSFVRVVAHKRPELKDKLMETSSPRPFHSVKLPHSARACVCVIAGICVDVTGKRPFRPSTQCMGICVRRPRECTLTCVRGRHRVRKLNLKVQTDILHIDRPSMRAYFENGGLFRISEPTMTTQTHTRIYNIYCTHSAI